MLACVATGGLMAVGEDNPHLRPFPLGAGAEGRARLALFERCPRGAHQLADPEGVLLGIAEKAGFDVMITTDQGIRNQQNLQGRELAF